MRLETQVGMLLAIGYHSPWRGDILLAFGIGGDVEVPNIDDFAKVLGITVDDIKKIINGSSITINGQVAKNLIDYIDKQDDNHLKDALDHLHADLGFNQTGHGQNAFGGQSTVKAYIDAKNKDLDKKIDDKIGELKAFTIAGLERRKCRNWQSNVSRVGKSIVLIMK